MTILCNSQKHNFLAPPSPNTIDNSMWNNTHQDDNHNNNNGNINQTMTMTMTSPHDDDDDSWEIRAFEEDTTGNLLGCTWPPRSYTCTFCRREFRSAQALGGHMNVHRRDRARLHHQAPPPPPAVIQASGLCLFYPLQNPNSTTIIFPTPLLPTSPFPKPSDTAPNSVVSSVCHSSNTEPSASNSYEHGGKEPTIEEELDLELRLGRTKP